MIFKGSCVALVTPFKNSSVDGKALRELVEFQIANKTAALVPCGSTGESATLSYEEHHEVIEIVVNQTRKRVPVIAGTGSNSTVEAIELTKHAQEVGADAALLIAPYYNKPTQKGLIEHFSAIAKNVSIPQILYNIPGRTSVNILPLTIFELAKRHKNIVGVKESSGNLEQMTEIACLMKENKSFALISGDDTLTLPILSVGGVGVISVLANIVPKDVAELCALHAAGKFNKALALHLKMFPLVKALFIETNPAPVKTAMEILGHCSSELRLPMVPLSAENRKKLTEEMKRYGLKGAQ